MRHPHSSERGVRGTWALILAGFALVAQAAISHAAPAAPEYEHLRIGWPRDITSLDPLGYARLSRPELNVHLHIFEHLLNRDERGQIVPHLAERYAAVDERTWRIHLRRGIKFHNGEPFTAEDVKFSFDDMKTSGRAPGLAQFVEDIENVRVVDPYIVEVRTKAPLPTLPARLTTYTLMVSAKQRKGQDPASFSDRPLGTGPFKFVEWRRGDRIVLERNEQYWKGMPRIKRVTIFIIPDDNTRVAALREGSIDIAVDVPEPLTDRVKNDPRLEITAAPSVRVQWIVLRHDVSPLNDVRVRQALNYTVNKDELVQRLLRGYGLPMGQPVPPYFFGYDPEVKPYPFDPRKARQLLAEAGYERGFEVTFRTVPIWEETARAVAGYLATFGVRTRFEVVEYGTMYSEFLGRRAAPLQYYSWGNWSLMDIDGTLPFVFACGGQWSYYCNPRLDALIEQMKTVDVRKRLRLAQQASRMLHEEAPVIYLFAQYDIHGKRKGLPEFTARTDNTVRFDWVR